MRLWIQNNPGKSLVSMIVLSTMLVLFMVWAIVSNYDASGERAKAVKFAGENRDLKDAKERAEGSLITANGATAQAQAAQAKADQLAGACNAAREKDGQVADALNGLGNKVDGVAGKCNANVTVLERPRQRVAATPVAPRSAPSSPAGSSASGGSTPSGLAAYLICQYKNDGVVKETSQQPNEGSCKAWADGLAKRDGKIPRLDTATATPGIAAPVGCESKPGTKQGILNLPGHALHEKTVCALPGDPKISKWLS